MDTQPQVNVPVDKQQARLDQLDDSQENQAKQKQKMKQGEYVRHMEDLNLQLATAWNNEERVKSLKIAIQCAKVLSDVSVIKFYPSKWVLITEILDTFGKLVYQRIWNRSITIDPKTKQEKTLPKNFTLEDIPKIAKETCRNWFFKIASIRELLPRLYIEMAIIKCYCFITDNSYKEVINRLSMMTRGIGDPLVAIYARTYLTRRGREIAPNVKPYLLQSLNDSIFTHNARILSEDFQQKLQKYIEIPEYMRLYTPAYEWVLQCIAHKADKQLFLQVLKSYKDSNNPLVLNGIVSSFKPEFIAAHARVFASMIREVQGDAFPQHQLYVALGVNIVLCPPPKEDVLPLLNDVWKVVTKITDPNKYMEVAEVWIEYPAKHCTKSHTNTLLADIIRHVKPNKAFEKLQLQLQSVVQKILAHYHDFTVIFGMSNFLPLLDMFTGNTQVEVNKAVLEAFVKHQAITRDPVIINSMFSVGKVVHDSVNALSFADEIRQISRLISAFIDKIDFGKEVEKHLNFYVDCRRAFANLDTVKSNLVLGVCRLAMKTIQLIGGRHNMKTAAFARACIAYCFITIPSMDDIFSRLYLYVLAGQVALINQSLPQADSLFKAAITLLQDVPPYHEVETQNTSTEPALVNFVKTLCSSLVVVPGHPEFGAFYLIKGLLKVIGEYKWEEGSSGKAEIFLTLLSVFSAQFQSALPYHINKVESNDVLYGGDPAFEKELIASVNKLVELTLADIKSLKESSSQHAQRKFGQLAIELSCTTLRLAKLTPESATLVVKLYELAKESKMKSREIATVVETAALKVDQGKLNAGIFKKLESMQ
eukprot:TRINITY_DN8265_c0_g1_i1.p1 TRINITY_DN8265_c0_g1~~TRINITY_DN8265_c0_g1_i1.p1  ORF type:complete len:820 (-),score=152.51 TRINITY_DN8265_c0_g1_i1:35-2494(-)